MASVRVAIVGVGNCANSLLQGVEYYRDAKAEDSVPGLMHVDLGGYHISDIEFTAAFDVVKGKVGVDVERGRELDVRDVVAAEIDVHQPGDGVARLGVVVVLDSLHERRRAVANADDCDAHLAGRGSVPVLRGRFGHIYPSAF